MLSAILRGQFFLEESAAQNYLPLVHQLRTGNFDPKAWADNDHSEQPAPAFYAISPGATSVSLLGYNSLDEVPAGSVAVVTVAGVMMEEDSCWGDLGTRSLGQRIEQADAHPNIAAHVVVWRTPGGSVMGLENFAGIIKNTQKPLVSYAELMCSAGLWAGSGADRIVVGGRTAQVGSIGTMISLTDTREYRKKLGMTDHTVRATDSFNKNEAWAQAMDGNYEPIQQQLLNPLNQVFHDTVKANLADTLPTDAKELTQVLSGLVYVGEDIVQKGLAHQLGTLQDALELAHQLAEEAATTTTTHSTTSNSSSTMGLFDRSSATTKFSKVGALSGQASPSAADVDAANAELRDAGITSAALITEASYTALEKRAETAEAVAKEVPTLKADLAKAQKDLKAAQDDVIRLGALDGAAPTTAAKKDGDSKEAPKASSYFDPNAEHNQEAAGLLG